MTGIVFAKFTKPAHRGKTIVFSDNALVTMRNGAFYLLCRVGDLRPSHLLESHISGTDYFSLFTELVYFISIFKHNNLPYSQVKNGTFFSRSITPNFTILKHT